MKRRTPLEKKRASSKRIVWLKHIIELFSFIKKNVINEE